MKDMRKNKFNLSISFDDKLSFALNSALSKYEFQRLSIQLSSDNDYSNLINEFIPTGHLFKAYPFKVLDRNPGVVCKTI